MLMTRHMLAYASGDKGAQLLRAYRIEIDEQAVNAEIELDAAEIALVNRQMSCERLTFGVTLIGDTAVYRALFTGTITGTVLHMPVPVTTYTGYDGKPHYQPGSALPGSAEITIRSMERIRGFWLPRETA